MREEKVKKVVGNIEVNVNIEIVIVTKILKTIRKKGTRRTKIIINTKVSIEGMMMSKEDF